MFFLCAGVYISMGIQIYLVFEAGYPLVNTALPLHICGMCGLLTFPMLYTNWRPLRAFYGFIGLPGAVMALCFPAVMASPHDMLMKAAFFLLHGLIVMAGSMAIFRRPRLRPKDAYLGYGIGVLFAGMVYMLNLVLSTNYMFLRFAPKGTPLEWMAQWGQGIYLLFLFGGALAMVSLMAVGLSFIYKSCIIRS